MKDFLKKFLPYSAGVKMRGLYQKALLIAYSGNKYYCPFCDNRFRKMLPGGEDHPVIHEKNIVGAGRRNNMLCPRCFSTDRDRLIYLYLKEKTEFLTKPASVLHIAPEGSLKHLLENLQNLEYRTGDKFEEGYTGYYYDRDVLQMDVTDISEPDESYDLVICNHVLEHIPDDRKAMREIYRILNPGGEAILQVPVSMSATETKEETVASDEERQARYGQFDHVRLYAADYKHRLAEEGFKVEVHNPEKDGWKSNLKEYAINPLENVYVGKK
ncbi:MAG: class I SAM-dependent methyltransferase [Bacteroidota bacterium]